MRALMFVLIGLVTTLCGCEPDYIGDAHEKVRATLNDPESAHFRGDKVYRRAGQRAVVCGAVNAKNVVGGYVGFRMYIAQDDSVQVIDAENASDFAGRYLELCSLSK